MDTDSANGGGADTLALREVGDGTYVVLGGPRPGESLSTTVVLAVAAVLDKDTDALKTLHSTINPDALDHFVNSATDGALSFTYAGCRVSIQCGGSIHIHLDPTE